MPAFAGLIRDLNVFQRHLLPDDEFVALFDALIYVCEETRRLIRHFTPHNRMREGD